MATRHCVHSLSKFFSRFSHLSIMLTLDPTTLFYWDLNNSSKKCKYDGSTISQWAHSIPHNAKPSSRASSIGKQSMGTNRLGVPSLTDKSTVTSKSALTLDIAIQQPSPPPWVFLKPGLEHDVDLGDTGIIMIDDRQLYMQEDGVISERDELEGKEHEDAIRSPPKGPGVHIQSNVKF